LFHFSRNKIETEIQTGSDEGKKVKRDWRAGANPQSGINEPRP
jgi:hypothetical protein